MQSLNRLLRITEAVARSADGATPTQVAAEVGLSLSTAARIMHELAAENVIERSEPTGHYRLGVRLVRMVQSSATHQSYQELARSVMRRLRDQSGETVSLHIRAGVQRICIASAQSLHPVGRVMAIGHALPLVGSATGDILLAGVPDAERSALLRELRLTGKQAEAKIDEIRRQGWRMISDDWVPGVTGISALVPSLGREVGALSISGPTERFGPEQAMAMMPDLLISARRLSDSALFDRTGDSHAS